MLGGICAGEGALLFRNSTVLFEPSFSNITFRPHIHGDFFHDQRD